MADSYHDRPEWSYSQLKLILDHGIDYAVASKRKMIPGPSSKAIDIGTLIHQAVLGGREKFVISPFDSFRTNAAKQWRDENIKAGNIIITQEEQAAIDAVVQNIKNHPYSKDYIFADGAKYEQEMYAGTEQGVDLRGKSDVNILFDKELLVITDLKTTGKFDRFFRDAQYKHYDMQSANYIFIAAAALGINPALIRYKFCVAETEAPYRVEFMNAGIDFISSGERKLFRCVEAVKEFGDKEPSFLVMGERDLGDLSL